MQCWSLILPDMKKVVYDRASKEIKSQISDKNCYTWK